MAPGATPDLVAVRAARDAQEDAVRALEAANLVPGQAQLLETLLDAVEARYRAGWWHLAGRLAELLPGVGPAIRELAEHMEWRIDQ